MTLGSWMDVRSRFKIARSTQKKYRLSGVWAEGVYWFRLGSRKTVLNLDLIELWVRLHRQPEALQRAIAEYQAKLPENQTPKRSRSKVAA